MATTTAFDRALDPIERCLTPDVARAILAIRADSETQTRIDELADKCNEGQLSPEERAEYEAYVWAGNFIALLKAQSRAVLARSNGS
jgi:hypothetical protein